MKKEINIGILFGHLFLGNMGCNALTYGAVAILQEVAKKLDVRFLYTFSENRVSEDLVIPDQLGLEGADVVQSFYKSWKSIVKSCLTGNLKTVQRNNKKLSELDICFCATGGDSFSDIYGERFYDILKTISYPTKKGVPLVMLPQTIGPFLSEKAERKAVALLKKTDAVFTRDPISTDLVKKLTPGVSLYESVDMAFYMKYTKHEGANSKIRVGINPSGLLWNGGYTGDNQFNLVESYPDAIRKTIEYFCEFDNIQIEFVPHVLCGPYSYPVEDDYRVCKLLKEEYPDCTIAPYFYTPVEAKSYISGLDFLLGSRMHCCIAAYSSGVPVMPLAYSRKFGGLFSNGLNYNHMSDLTKDDLSTTLEKINHAFNSRESILKEMPGRLSILEEHKGKLISQLTDVIDNLIKE